ncbi:MAG: magnesium transporter, partial [Flavobacteriales bacterium]|nr:magnesium transporter [Flavobacteriales bacterium]
MFDLTREFVTELKEHVSLGKDTAIQKQLSDLHPADIADIFEELKSDEMSYVYKLLETELAADVIVELEEDVRDELLTSLTSKEIAEEVIEHIDSDDASDMISELPEDKIEEIISHIEDEDKASDIVDLLAYEEGTAGALMAKELVQVNLNWTVAHCIREMRKQAEELENIYTIYVVDDKNVLKGRLSLKKLLFSATTTRTMIKDIYFEGAIQSVLATDEEEKVASIMEKYDLVALPVLNENGQLLGRITIDDVVDVIMEEAEKDYQMASGLSEDVESSDSVWTMTRARNPWLLIGMAGGISAAYVIRIFDIEKNTALALFIPLIAAMAGNAGVQSAAIVVQGLANENVKMDAITKKLGKELVVGLFNGLICSVVLFLAAMILQFPIELSITVSISLLAVITFAAV